MSYDIKLMPRSERETLIHKRLEASTEPPIEIYDFRGDKTNLKVISLSIDVPVYRMESCRTFTDQHSEIATKGLEKTHFSKGQELSTVQAEQHHILVKLAKRGSSSVSPIIDVLQKEGQREPILITSTGVVVNGNRRLSAIRELFAEEESVNSRFNHVKCQVLPSDTTPDEIDDIEANLQARPQTKLDYDWIGDAQLVRRQVNKNRTTNQVAEQLRRSESEIKNLLQALDEADLYLNEWAEKPGQYALVSGDAEQIFGDIPKKIANKNMGLQDASRAIAWSLFENREKLPGRLYSFNAAFGDLAPQVLDTLADQLDLADDQASSEDDPDNDFSIDIMDGEETADYSTLIDALRKEETKDDAVDALIDACESAIEKEKGKKSEKAALKALSQVHSKLAGIDVNSAGESTLPGMGKQLDSIKEVLAKIEARLIERRKNIKQSAGSSE